MYIKTTSGFLRKTIFASSFITLYAIAPASIAQTNETLPGDSVPVQQGGGFDENWTPPIPKQSEEPQKRKRGKKAQVSYGQSSRAIAELPSDDDFLRLGFLSQPLVPVPGESSEQETRKLAATMRAYQQASDTEDVSAIDKFIKQNPDSRWNPVLLLNLGVISYDTGHFSKALDYWNASWELAKAGNDLVSKRIANQAVAEYAKMCARIGRVDELERIFTEVGGREFMGDSRVKINNARDGLWTMHNKPGIAFRCGPYALANVAPLLRDNIDSACTALLERVQSPKTGFSLNEVEAMSTELGLGLQKAKRSPGAEIIVPSVVHWKVGHYGALTREMNGKYLLKDPTFGNSTWLSAEALDAEGSGYFLVPEGQLPKGWTIADDVESAKIYGKGHSGNGGDDDSAPEDHQTGGGCDGIAMATYSFHTLLASLRISDTPVGYPAARGNDVRVEVNYNQREAGQPTTIDYTNFSPQWENSWISYIEDNPSSPGADVTLSLAGGGARTYQGYNPGTRLYDIEPRDLSILKLETGNNTYSKTYPDGSVEYYEQYIGTTGTKRKIFLSRMVDPQGNEVTLEYDTTYPTRLKHIYDATNLRTDFFYDYTGEPYLVTSIEDPFGRTATFNYSTVNGVIRLTSIEDVIGITSSFGYDSTGGITSLTTPYGTTTFELSEQDLGNYDLIRYIEATDPYGDKERIEYNLSSAQTGLPSSIDETLPDNSIVAYREVDNDDRNSFYWDKQQMRYGEGNYSKAHLYHWLQPDAGDAAISILESEKPPLEGRTWYNYPGQTDPWIQGDIASPSVVGRVVESENGSYQTQAFLYEYNSLGNPTKMTDPKGRETVITYDTNGIDILSIKQKVGESGGSPIYETLATYTYDVAYPAHRPKTVTDASGSVTTFTYNAYGQTKTITNELNEVITFTYETNASNDGYGKPLTITGDVPGGNVTFTYDSHDRVRTVTDSEGHVITYDYDALDRVTVITYPDTSYEQFDYKDHNMVAFRDREGRWTRYLPNALMQIIAERDPLGRLTQYEWCRCGDIRKIIDGVGNVTHWVRDVQGRVTEKRYPDGTKYSYDYYPLSGQLKTTTDALDQIKNFAYYLDSNLASVDYSATNTPDVIYTYDPIYDRMTSMADGIGFTDYYYHPFDGTTHGAGQVFRIDGPFTDDTLKYTYDDLGRLKKRQIVDDATYTTASYSEEFVFDARSRVDQTINDLGTFDYTYVGQSDRMDKVDYPNSMSVEYDYFTASGDFMLKQIKNLSSGVTPQVISQFDYTYTQDRMIDSWAVKQGSSPADTWGFTYDDAFQLTGAVRKDSTQTLVDSLRYGYDKVGNRISTTDDGTTTNYATNSNNQLTAEQGFGPTLFSGTLNEPASVTVDGQPATVMSDGGSAPYTFEALIDLTEGSNNVIVEAMDGNGNTATDTFTVTVGGVQKQLEYDLNGNLRFEKNAIGTVLKEYQWDAENRLLAMQDSAVGSEINGTKRSEFAYDGQSRRVGIVEKTHNGTVWVLNSDDYYIWESGTILQRRADKDSYTIGDKNYFAGGYQVEAGVTDTDYYYTRDHLGSIREVVASDGTTVKSRLDYDPWGVTTVTSDTLTVGHELDFGYTGHLRYDRFGDELYLTWFRAYDAGLGRWLSRDPLGELGPDGANVYTYTRNSPITYHDVFGGYTTLPPQLWPNRSIVGHSNLKDRIPGPGRKVLHFSDMSSLILNDDGSTSELVGYQECDLSDGAIEKIVEILTPTKSPSELLDKINANLSNTSDNPIEQVRRVGDGNYGGSPTAGTAIRN